MIAKINQKMTQTTRTLKISGNAPTSAFTTTFIPSIFAIALNGRNALSVLIVLNKNTANVIYKLIYILHRKLIGLK